jgi:hypothetical protein
VKALFAKFQFPISMKRGLISAQKGRRQLELSTRDLILGGEAMKSTKLIPIILGALLIMTGSGWVSRLCAQTASSGALVGTVTDTSGGVIPNATVSLTSNATNQTQTATTSANGTYRFPLLSPGTYTVRFSMQGFKGVTVQAVTVNVTETPVLDAKLEVGETTQEVTVTGQAPAIDTESSAVGGLIDSKTITDIPLTTRNYTQVLSLTSGVTVAVYNAGGLGTGTQDVNTNGMSTQFNTYNMDGANASNWESGSAVPGSTSTGLSIPNPDALAEFKIQTSQFDAGYGRQPGANVNVVTKSGSNQFHGAIWEFVRNDMFNANDFFRNRLQQGRPTLKQNQFGGTFGGPIKKDKLFFFGSYQGTRQLNGIASTGLVTSNLPPLTTDRTAAGLAAQFCPGNKVGAAATPYKTFDPLAKQLDCNNATTATTLPINPVALAVLNLKLPNGQYYVPVPQTILASGVGQSSFSIPNIFNENQYLINVDYVISSKHTLHERYFYANEPTERTLDAGGSQPGAPAGSGSAGLVPGPGADVTDHYKNHNAMLKLTSILTPNFVNEVFVSFAHFESVEHNIGIPTAASIGMAPMDPLFAGAINFNVYNGLLGNLNLFAGNINDFTQKDVQLQIADQISWIHGKHSIRAGVSEERLHWTFDSPGRARGSIYFQSFDDFLIGQSAAVNGSPQGLSNVFGESITPGNGATGGLQPFELSSTASAFVVDDFKVNSRFTLNLGLRWEYNGSPWDTFGIFGNVNPNIMATVPIPPPGGTLVGETVAANYNPNFVLPLTGLSYGLPAGVTVRPTKGAFTNDPQIDNFAPRFGFAWQPGSDQHSLVVRGGYGWFYVLPGGNGQVVNAYTTQPFNARISKNGVGLGTATEQLPDVVQLGFRPRTVTVVNGVSVPSTLTDNLDGPDLITSMVQEWSLNGQYQIKGSWVAEIGYVGTRGAHLGVTKFLNQAQLASPTNPVNCGLPTGCITTNTAANAALRVPFVGETTTAMSEASSWTGNQWYHGLGVTLRKDLSHGLNFKVAYTFSKAEATPNYMNDQNNPASQWALTNFNRAHRRVVSYSYLLPSPQENRFAKAALGGWMLSGVTIAQKGTPLTLTDSKAGTAYGSPSGATVTLCPGMTNASLLTTGGNDQARLNNWFNKSAICAAPTIDVTAYPGSTASLTLYGNTGQFIVTGPGQFNWDLSISKTTKVGGIHENGELQFRTEFYNAFNHPQFANPATGFGSSSFGVITAESVSPRLIQFGLKYLF